MKSVTLESTTSVARRARAARMTPSNRPRPRSSASAVPARSRVLGIAVARASRTYSPRLKAYPSSPCDRFLRYRTYCVETGRSSPNWWLRRATTAVSTGRSGGGRKGEPGARWMATKVRDVTAKTMAAAAAMRRISQSLPPPTSALAIPIDETVGGDPPGPHQRPVGVGPELHVGNAGADGGHVVGRGQPDPGCVGVDDVQRPAPVAPRLLRRGGRRREVHQSVEVVIGPVAVVVGGAMGPVLRDARSRGRVGVEHLDDGVELARSQPVRDEILVEGLDLQIHTDGFPLRLHEPGKRLPRTARGREHDFDRETDRILDADAVGSEPPSPCGQEACGAGRVEGEGADRVPDGPPLRDRTGGDLAVRPDHVRQHALAVQGHREGPADLGVTEDGVRPG